MEVARPVRRAGRGNRPGRKTGTAPRPDPYHTGNVLAAESASLRDLMARMGHSSTRAALIYQHASRERERAIGAAISARVEAARPDSKGHAGGTTAGQAKKSKKAPKQRKRP